MKSYSLVQYFSNWLRKKKTLFIFCKKTFFFFQGIVRFPVNFYYGNDAGLLSNYGALKELTNIRNSYPLKFYQQNLEGIDEAKHLDDFGYVLLGKTSDSEIIAEAVNRVKTGFENPNEIVEIGSEALIRILNPERIPQVRVLFNRRISEVLFSYYKCNFYISDVKIWRTSYIPNVDLAREDVFSNTFHHDNCKVTGLRVFILLNDGVTDKTGATRLHDKQTSKKLIRSFGYFHRFFQPNSVLARLFSTDTMINFEGNAGDCLILNTQECLHAASMPMMGSYRDVIQFTVYPKLGALGNPFSSE